MTVQWEPWMRWIDRGTGELRRFAPPWVVKRYQSYQKSMEELRELVAPDPPGMDELGEPSISNWVPIEEVIRRNEAAEKADKSGD